ncbi:MAG: acyltransferase, partial [Sweet potato little leaf phytoplasma]|nr:acyltransferase [Sweet potato little leaf phytoplasma]
MKSLSLTIHSSSTILPSHPTPHRTLPLSECDQMTLEGHVFTFYVYKPSNNNTSSPISIDSLRTSLSQILVPYYPVAGRLRWTPCDRLELHCCAAGACFIEAKATTKLDDHNNFESCDVTVTKQLIPSVDYEAPIHEQPVLLVQVTRFACGGIVIGTALSHFLID